MVQLRSSASPPPSQQTPRPPTPPRGSTKNAVVDLLPQTRRARPSSPTPSTEFTTPVDKSKKKVEWSSLTDYQEHPDISARQNTALLSKLTPLPPSGERKPPRSILKSRNVLSPRDLNDNTTPTPTHQNFPAMLESMVRQLAGEDRTSRIDAYTTLSGALKAYDNVPDLKALKDKMGLISQFIQRDFHAKTSGGDMDAALVTNALTLLSSLLYKPSVTELFDHDFCVFVMDYAIDAFETGRVSKDIMNRLIFMVDHQNFSTRVMNTERVGKLITALHNIENHVKGKGIVMGRLSIYSRLLRQSKSSMLANTIWLEDMLHEMVSNFKDIRSLAINFGIEAGLLLGQESQTSRALQEIFRTERDGNRFAEFYAGRLRKMLKGSNGGGHVPQIWIVVILFLRHKPRQIEQWELMKPWLVIVQDCLNSVDLEIKIQASRAWNRFVFAIHPDEQTTASMVNMLCTPIIGQLMRKLPTRNATEYRTVLTGCVCNLLYYAFRPNSSFTQIDRYWDAYVVRLMGLPVKAKDSNGKKPTDSKTNVESLSSESLQACLILKGLLDTTPRIWVENRANQVEPVTPSEIPGLDPQWIRKNTSRVLAVMEPLIGSLFADLSVSDSPVSSLWDTFCEAIKAAGAKEIKVSNDTMNSIAQIFGMLYRLWSQQVSISNVTLFQGFGCVVSSMISRLGALPFTEKLLSLDLQNTFDVIVTPSHRPKSARGVIKCPLHHLIVLISHVPKDLLNTDDYTEMVKKILTPLFNSRESRTTRLAFVHEITQLLPSQSPLGELSNSPMWEILAKFTEQALETPEENRSSRPNSEPQLGSEYRYAVNILEAGLGIAPASTLLAARKLFQALTARARAESGDSGVAIAVIEPLARGLLERRVPVPDDLLSSYCTMLVASAQYPKDNQSLNAARRRLWGSTNEQRLPSADPYNLLYGLVSHILKSTYGKLSLDDCKFLILEVSAMLERCPVSHLFHALDKLQDGLSCWIQDKDHKLVDQEVATMLCQQMNSSIKKLSNANSSTLKKLSDLISCGLESRHKSIANAAAETWNSTFGSQKSLDYPSRVLEALSRLRLVAELKLPSFPDSLPTDFNSAPPAFFESQVTEPTPLIPVTSNPATRHLTTPSKESSNISRKDAPKTQIEAKQSRKRRFEGTPEPIQRKQNRGHSTPKLRHDDSQVQFAPIESSPMSATIMDSQVLTDRQKEVKERQKADAAARFQDFGSSPNLKIDRAIPLLPLRPHSPSPNAAAEDDGPKTPSINPAAPNVFDDYIPSSPTPRRGNSILPDSDAIEPPSSPPEKIVIPFSSPQLHGKSAAASQDYDETSWDITVGSEGIMRPKLVTESETPENAIQSTEADGQSPRRDDRSDVPIEPPSTPIRVRTERIRSHQSPGTESEVFMDALSTPAKSSPNKSMRKKFTQGLTNESSTPSSIPLETPARLQPSPSSQGSQGMARGIFNAAMNLPTNIKSFISPPKQKTPNNTASSPLDEDSVLRVMNQFDQPEKETPIRASNSQPTSHYGEDFHWESGISSDGSKKRKRASSIPLAVEPNQSLPPKDSQESWRPSQEEEFQLHFNPLVSKAMFPSTIPETPIRPGLAVSNDMNSINTATTISRRPFTRSSKRLQLAENRLANSTATDQSVARPETRELPSSYIPNKEIKAQKPNLPESTTDLSTSIQDFNQISSMDFSFEGSGSIGENGHFTSTPRAQISVEVDGSSNIAPGISTLNANAPPANTEEGPGDAEDQEDEEEEEEISPARDERSSSPSQQLLRDTDESSQRLLAMNSPSMPEIDIPQETNPSKSVTEHLQTALAGLRGASLSREEVFNMEVLLLDFKRELFAAEERGQGERVRS